MTIHFTKMQGLGNDFVVIDATKKPFQLSAQQIKKMADRHLGVGFDQLLIIEPSTNAKVDFNYRIYNADGSEAGQCGNGARCIGKYIIEHELSQKHELTVATIKDQLQIRFEKDGQISVNMGIPNFDPKKIPFNTPHEALRYTLPVNNEQIEIGAMSIGNPHAVIEVTNINTAPVEKLGPLIEKHPQFPQRVNVGFMQIINPQKIRLRVYERGAGETLACGSGACAAVAIGRLWKKLDEKVTVELPGGNLTLQWQGPNHPLWMTGPAEEAFTGEWPILFQP